LQKIEIQSAKKPKSLPVVLSRIEIRKMRGARPPEAGKLLASPFGANLPAGRQG